jgi:hypothetical protein
LNGPEVLDEQSSIRESLVELPVVSEANAKRGEIAALPVDFRGKLTASTHSLAKLCANGFELSW